LLLIAIAFVLPRIGMNACSQRRVAWTFVAVAWANTAFYFFGNLAPNRGITFGGNRFGDATWMGLFAMAPAFLGAVATVIVLVVLIRQTFRD
jgi:styrene-oxide isomerase